ncbi:hypothetical protein BJ170DRAFT_578280 [Xylariales sp. AK1849]|nr:hypothetical protein BJ170DRAFT_578280 [Xylariales sp. AK1849]
MELGISMGVVGVSYLGHCGVIFTKAMGAKVVRISRKASKRQNVIDAGADEYIVNNNDNDWTKKHSQLLRPCHTNCYVIKGKSQTPFLPISF